MTPHELSPRVIPTRGSGAELTTGPAARKYPEFSEIAVSGMSMSPLAGTARRLSTLRRVVECPTAGERRTHNRTRSARRRQNSQTRNASRSPERQDAGQHTPAPAGPRSAMAERTVSPQAIVSDKRNSAIRLSAIRPTHRSRTAGVKRRCLVFRVRTLSRLADRCRARRTAPCPWPWQSPHLWPAESLHLAGD